MPEQVRRPNPWRRKIMRMVITLIETFEEELSSSRFRILPRPQEAAGTFDSVGRGSGVPKGGWGFKPPPQKINSELLTQLGRMPGSV
jgi:hypothetical protein